MAQQNEDYKKDENEQKVIPPQGSALQTIGTAAPSSAQPQQPQGSGRFVNLQKYIKANQGAGERIAGAVGQGVDKGVQKEETEASKYYGKLGESVNKAKDTIKTGYNISDNLRNIGKDIQGQVYSEPAKQKGSLQSSMARPQAIRSIDKFTGSDAYQQYGDISSGRGVNESLLAAQQARAAREAGQYQQVADTARQDLTTEGGRYNLLRKTFGGSARPDYTTGEQRLDQLFMSRSGALKGLQQTARERAKAAQGLAGEAQQQFKTVQDIAAEEGQLVGDINQQALANEKVYQDMMRSYVDPNQAARDAEVERVRTTIDNLKNYDPSKGAKLPQSVLTQLGLNPNLDIRDLTELGRQRILGNRGTEYDAATRNIFADIDPASLYTTGKRLDASGKDFINAEGLARYNTLADMAGVDSRAYSEVGSIDPTWSSTGKLNQVAQEQVNEFLRAQEQGYGTGGYSRGSDVAFGTGGNLYGAVETPEQLEQAIANATAAHYAGQFPASGNLQELRNIQRYRAVQDLLDPQKSKKWSKF